MPSTKSKRRSSGSREKPTPPSSRNAQQETEDREDRAEKIQSLSPPPHAASGDQIVFMPRKTNIDKPGRSSRGRGPTEVRTPRPKPKIDFTAEALDFKN